MDVTEAPIVIHWMPQANFRGTFDILSICLGTMLINVWNVVHPSVPVRRQSTLESLASNVGLMFAALLFPEYFMFRPRGGRLLASDLVAVAKRCTEVSPLEIKPRSELKRFFSRWSPGGTGNRFEGQFYSVECMKTQQH